MRLSVKEKVSRGKGRITYNLILCQKNISAIYGPSITMEEESTGENLGTKVSYKAVVIQVRAIKFPNEG